MPKFLRETGVSALEVLATRSEGITAREFAAMRGQNIATARKALYRLVEWGWAKTEPADDCGNVVNKLVFTLTRKGRDVADGVQDYTDGDGESHDDSLDVFEHGPTEPMVQNAIATQPKSVFDLGRVMHAQAA